MNVKRVLTFVAHGFEALVTIGQVAESLVGRNATAEEALAVLSGIAALAKSLQAGLSDTGITPEDIQDDIGKLRRMIADNNAAIDHSIDAKFPKG
jgi:hypothetical protein